MPSPHNRIGLELSLSLGAQQTEAEVVLRADPSYRSDYRLTFLGLYGALELESAIRVRKRLELVIAARIEGGRPHTWKTTKILRNSTDFIRHTEDWQVGRPSLGLALGIRVPFY